MQSIPPTKAALKEHVKKDLSRRPCMGSDAGVNTRASFSLSVGLDKGI